MDGKKLFTCHLEAEEGQYPEYCVQDVCCGVYKQRNWVVSLFCLLLTSLLIISLTCLLIYAWVTYKEDNEDVSQPAVERMGSRNRRSGPYEKEREEKSNLTTGKPSEKKEPEPDEEEEEEETDEEEDEGDHEPAITQDSRDKNTKKELENEHNNESNNEPKMKTKKKTDRSTSDPGNEKDKVMNQDQNENRASTSSTPSGQEKDNKQSENSPKKKNENYKITYVKEVYSFPSGDDPPGNQEERQEPNKEDSKTYFNMEYKQLDIKTKTETI